MSFSVFVFVYWQASQVGSSIAQNFGATSSVATAAYVGICADTAFNSPPRPVDFSAELTANERK